MILNEVTLYYSYSQLIKNVATDILFVIKLNTLLSKYQIHIYK